jgi:hypothetical protein
MLCGLFLPRHIRLATPEILPTSASLRFTSLELKNAPQPSLAVLIFFVNSGLYSGYGCSTVSYD